jgi:hypothetical protein
MQIQYTIRGIQQAQAKNNQRIARLQPASDLGKMIQNVTIFTHRQAVAVTHVDTGALKGSHRMKITGERGLVYLDPGAVNPRSKAKVVDYGPIEHARGGSHAFYTLAEQASAQYFKVLARALVLEVTK